MSTSPNQCRYFAMSYDKVAILLHHNARTDNMQVQAYHQHLTVLCRQQLQQKITSSQ